MSDSYVGEPSSCTAVMHFWNEVQWTTVQAAKWTGKIETDFLAFCYHGYNDSKYQLIFGYVGES